eukprot:731119-Alexandrium_andersonii.AAC.1
MHARTHACKYRPRLGIGELCRGIGLSAQLRTDTLYWLTSLSAQPPTDTRIGASAYRRNPALIN